MYALRYTSGLEAAQLLAQEHESLLRRVLAWQQVIYTDDKTPGWLADSLINILYQISEDGMWAQALPPLPDWVRKEDGLFGRNECPHDVCCIDMVNKYWLATGNEEMLRELYPFVKNLTMKVGWWRE